MIGFCATVEQGFRPEDLPMAHNAMHFNPHMSHGAGWGHTGWRHHHYPNPYLVEHKWWIHLILFFTMPIVGNIIYFFYVTAMRQLLSSRSNLQEKLHQRIQ